MFQIIALLAVSGKAHVFKISFRLLICDGFHGLWSNFEFDIYVTSMRSK